VSWIVARTEPLRERAAQHFLGLNGFESYCPRLRVIHRSCGRRIETRPCLFPSYLFVAFRNGQWWDARWCVGVAAIIMSGSEPAQLGDHIVDEIRARERDGAVVLPARPKLKPGDRVRVVAGPFTGHLAIFADMRPRQRVEILLQLLGGEQRVTLARKDIEVVR